MEEQERRIEGCGPGEGFCLDDAFQVPKEDLAGIVWVH